MTDLQTACAALEQIAPTGLAGSWDNVGLLVEGTRQVERIGLCIDLTEPVLAELADADVDLIISYHPPIFGGLKRVTQDVPLQRVVAAVLRSGRHLYAPHTALDAARGGMAEWLADGLGPAAACVPVDPRPDQPDVGVGRQGTLAAPRSLRELLPGLRAHLGIAHLRVAGDLDQPRSSFAVCPGSGGGVFKGAPGLDLYVTGEWSHHDVLAQVARGGAVVLTDHTQCERGYLPFYADKIRAALPGVSVRVSEQDADPLVIL